MWLGFSSPTSPSLCLHLSVCASLSASVCVCSIYLCSCLCLFCSHFSLSLFSSSDGLDMSVASLLCVTLVPCLISWGFDRVFDCFRLVKAQGVPSSIGVVQLRGQPAGLALTLTLPLFASLLPLCCSILSSLILRCACLLLHMIINNRWCYKLITDGAARSSKGSFHSFNQKRLRKVAALSVCRCELELLLTDY